MMRLFPRLRRSVALWICPEIAAAMRQDERQMRELRVAAGFLDQDEARAHRRARKAWVTTRMAQVHRRSLGDYPRICLPGVVISRAVGALLHPIQLAGPELFELLEQHVERRDDKASLSRLQRWSKSAAIWLLQVPNTEPDTTEGDVPDRPAWLAAALGLPGSHPEKQTLSAAGFAAAEASDPSSPQGCLQDAAASPNHNTQGVR